jgi:histidine triad (HIT) family protein
MSCLFCRIARKEMNARIVYEDEHIVCFHDIMPQAPVHCLLIPRLHFSDLFEADEEGLKAVGHLMVKVPVIARELGLEKEGYRLVNNCKERAGQSVWHFHLHLLGGRIFGWPPG